MRKVYRLGLVAAGALVSAALVLAGGAPAAASSGGAYHGVATWALPPGIGPTYIFPMTSFEHSSDVNLYEFQNQMYRPLYWFGINGTPVLDKPLSLANPPVLSNGGKTATITLKHYIWSDGQPVTSRDVEFWMDLFKANPDNWQGYVPGGIPDNIASMSFPSSTPYTFSLTFTKTYNPTWLIYNELSQITPMPQHVWDRTSTTGAVGNYDLTAAGANDVYNFLNTQAEDVAGYGTNPLWKVVDGPWVLSQYSPSTTAVTFVPNTKYNGPQKPHLAKFEEVPFTSSAAEYDALRAGDLDYGYLPIQDVSQRSYFSPHGYKIVPWEAWSVNYISINFTNPKTGPLFDQLYIRQAMQRLINQPAIIKDLLHGTGYPTYGPVPVLPKTSYVSPGERQNPYPYSVSAAKSLLTSHGWTVRTSGASTCAKPGTGPGECGSGIAKGESLTFKLEYPSGAIAFSAEMQEMKSSWAQAGIVVNLSTAPFDTVYSTATPCVPSSGVGCTWDIHNVGSEGLSWSFAPDYYPSGEDIFAGGSESDQGGYNNSEANALIAATETEPGLQPLYTYENYIARQLPVLFQPSFYFQVSVISKHLHGAVPQDPILNIYPENWTLSS
jgi:peptide/nickel transport system substrate-binding protein